ncbi:MAG: hypothetical protein AVDCRST_MAG26-1694 [uncultured Chloroflexia bacterium]|uniref:Fis family transcriptional regulator n=1 Tax=uncultured Chloroflexia bacterium TaxID=1672391 RepID=A0A6J4I9T1_9CHLR|nr:MAG: hypothetical protein AVDCRST_MAG26-1694 [uncultured Chloroflexia bacterium]
MTRRYPLLTVCPVCRGPFHVTALACDRCVSRLEGTFALGWLGQLSGEQLEFVRLMIKNRGNINSVAAELKIAYNTARSRLDDIVLAMGGPPPPPPPPVDRRAVLDRLSSGELSVDEAMRILRGEA